MVRGLIGNEIWLRFSLEQDSEPGNKSMLKYSKVEMSCYFEKLPYPGGLGVQGGGKL